MLGQVLQEESLAFAELSEVAEQDVNLRPPGYETAQRSLEAEDEHERVVDRAQLARFEAAG